MNKNTELIENSKNESIEIELLLEAIWKKYGYDFRRYSRSHIKRMIRQFQLTNEIGDISNLCHKVLYDKEIYKKILIKFSINVTEMFRDPSFFLSFRKKIIPVLKTYPSLKIWIAGCSSGEEAYSLAIILHEEGLLAKSQIYATDFNKNILKRAKEAIFKIDKFPLFTENYQKSGGKRSFSDYYSANYGLAILKDFLKEKITFSEHNLVTDGKFGEMQLIFCRNVMIYFNNDLQNRVVKLFENSLIPGGFLCLGTKEDLMFLDNYHKFKTLDNKNKIYKLKYDL